MLNFRQNLTLSINPLYKCNLNCPFCYLGELKNNNNILDLTYLSKVLTNLSCKYNITSIDIYGGEVSELSDFYFDFLVKLCKTFCKDTYVTTNFVKFHKPLINNFNNIGVSLDFNNYREQQSIVYDNIKAAVDSGKVINILTLDISCQDNKENIISKLNELKIHSWRIIPYSKSIHNKRNFISYEFFENTIKEYLKLKNKMNFNFINAAELDGIINYNYYNTNHLFITPNNKTALLKYNENNEEFFEEYDNLEDLYLEIEKEESKKEKYCGNCKYKNECLAEHYNYNYKGNSCSGFKNLIEFYKNDN